MGQAWASSSGPGLLHGAARGQYVLLSLLFGQSPSPAALRRWSPALCSPTPKMGSPWVSTEGLGLQQALPARAASRIHWAPSSLGTILEPFWCLAPHTLQPRPLGSAFSLVAAGLLPARWSGRHGGDLGRTCLAPCRGSPLHSLESSLDVGPIFHCFQQGGWACCVGHSKLCQIACKSSTHDPKDQK